MQFAVTLTVVLLPTVGTLGLGVPPPAAWVVVPLVPAAWVVVPLVPQEEAESEDTFVELVELELFPVEGAFVLLPEAVMQHNIAP
jgi:hypothetical protein